MSPRDIKTGHTYAARRGKAVRYVNAIRYLSPDGIAPRVVEFISPTTRGKRILSLESFASWAGKDLTP